MITVMALATILLCVGLLAWAKWAELDLARLAKFEEHADAFYAASDALIEDEDTPADVLREVAFLNRVIAFRHSPRALNKVLSEPMPAADEPGPPPLDPILDKRPELFLSYLRAMHAAFMAISYLDLWYGPRLRSSIAGLIDVEPKRSAASLARKVDRVRTTSWRDLQPAC